MKRVFLIFVFLMLVLAEFQFPSSKVEVMSGLLKPNTIKVDRGQIIIVDKAEVKIYSTKDLKLQKKFGGKGEGPLSSGC